MPKKTSLCFREKTHAAQTTLIKSQKRFKNVFSMQMLQQNHSFQTINFKPFIRYH